MPRPFELEQLEAALHAEFGALIPLQVHGSDVEKKRNFFSRSLAGFLVDKLSGCGSAAAADSVLDASGDGGIDAVYVDLPQQTIWLVQSKYIESGDGEPDLGGLAKFLLGVDNLLAGHHRTFEENPGWRAKLLIVARALAGGGMRVRGAIVYSSFRLMGEDRKQAIDRLQSKYPDPDYLQVNSYSLESLHRHLTAKVLPQGVDEVSMEILMPSRVATPYATLTGQVRGSQLVQLYQAHREKLIASNIRKYKGSTEVNEEIVKTAYEEPERFFYLNNGLTAFCQRWIADYRDLTSSQSQRVTAYGFSVVNGAQTLGSLVNALTKEGARPDRCLVSVKLISLGGTPDDRELARTITKSTNYQNTIGPRDLVALDEQQGIIAASLSIAGLQYHFKDAEDNPVPDAQNLNFDEAIVALACAEQEASCDLIARVLSNRRSLYSFEEVYPDDPDRKSRYDRLFPPTLSARRLWRAVQVYRQVFAQLGESARTETGVRRSFFENVRPLVLNLVFLKLRPELQDGLTLTPEEETTARARAVEIAEVVWMQCDANGYVTRKAVPSAGEVYDVPRHFRSVFCSASDSAILRRRTLSALGRPAGGPVIVEAGATPEA